MRNALVALAIISTLAGCSSALVPSFAVYADGDAVARIVAGTEYVVLQGRAGGALRVMTRLAPGGAYAEVGRLPVEAGATRAWRVSWGGSGADGWIDLEVVPCDDVRTAYPWIECPEIPVALKAAPERRESVRFPAYVERR